MREKLPLAGIASTCLHTIDATTAMERVNARLAPGIRPTRQHPVAPMAVNIRSGHAAKAAPGKKCLSHFVPDTSCVAVNDRRSSTTPHNNNQQPILPIPNRFLVMPTPRLLRHYLRANITNVREDARQPSVGRRGNEERGDGTTLCHKEHAPAFLNGGIDQTGRKFPDASSSGSFFLKTLTHQSIGFR